MNIWELLAASAIIFLVVLSIMVHINLTLKGPEDVKLYGLDQNIIYVGEGDACSTVSDNVVCKSGLECIPDETYIDPVVGSCKKIGSNVVSHKISQ